MTPSSMAMSAGSQRAVAPPQGHSEYGPTPASDALNLNRWLAVVRRRWRILATVLVVGIALTLSYTLLQTPLYTGAAQVALNVRDEQLVRLTETPKSELQLDRDASLVDTQAEILRSPRLAAWVVDNLRLDRDPEFIDSGGPAWLPSLGRGAEPSPAQLRSRAITKVRKRLAVLRMGDTYVIEVQFESQNPDKAARIADAFANGYLLEQRRVKVEAKQDAAAWLQTRIGELRGQLQSAEAAVAQFKIANNLMSAAARP
jgi:succinoglycan biosynthesis transport protein ExoP